MGLTPSLRKKRMTDRCSFVHVASGAAIFTLPLHCHVAFLHCTATCRSLFKPWVSLSTYKTIELCFEFLSHFKLFIWLSLVKALLTLLVQQVMTPHPESYCTWWLQVDLTHSCRKTCPFSMTVGHIPTLYNKSGRYRIWSLDDNWLQWNSYGLPAVSNGWNMNKPVFQEASVFSSPANWWWDHRWFLKHWFIHLTTTRHGQ